MTGIPPAPRGDPEIDVTFDIDANGLLNVEAMEKATGNGERITITNDKGRLSKEDIERMVGEAEKYRVDDEKQRARLSAKNKLQNYCSNMMKSTTNDDQISGKFTIEIHITHPFQ